MAGRNLLDTPADWSDGAVSPPACWDSGLGQYRLIQTGSDQSITLTYTGVATVSGDYLGYKTGGLADSGHHFGEVKPFFVGFGADAGHTYESMGHGGSDPFGEITTTTYARGPLTITVQMTLPTLAGTGAYVYVQPNYWTP